MTSDEDWNGSSDEYNSECTSVRQRKRRKVVQGTFRDDYGVQRRRSSESTPSRTSIIDDLLGALNKIANDASFEPIIEPLLPEYRRSEIAVQEKTMSYDDSHVTALSRAQARRLLESATDSSKSPVGALIARKLHIHPSPLRAALLGISTMRSLKRTVSPLSTPRNTSTVNSQVLDALYATQTTPYERSFLSRIQGFYCSRQPGVLAVDWEARAPWMDLMLDIREHFTLMHPEREQPAEVEAPIEYSSLRSAHLDQVHRLLGQVFWEGIDVSDALQYNPEKSTVVATYKKLVVGVALLSSPQETYITYLAVKPGWENAQIATSMLYFLISLNPNKDITLHVSINNPAMLLYNRFGFKAEEFVVGFYEDYLDAQSRASKNAFRLRLRR